MATLAVSQISQAGIVDPTLSASAAGGDKFVNNGKTFLKIRNSAATAGTVTIDSLVNCSQGEDHNLVIAINNEYKLVGPFPMDQFNDANGMVSITPNAQTATITYLPISI